MTTPRMLRCAVCGALCVAAGLFGTAAFARPVRATPIAAAGNVASVLVYAAPAGTGDTCTQSAPCNLVAAQSRVRKTLAAAHGAVQVKVVLAGGTYRLAAPLRFGPADSGAPGHPVEWSAAPGVVPVLSGAVRVTGWKAADAAKHIFEARVSAAADTRQVYVDGREVPVAGVTPAAEHITFEPANGGYRIKPAAWVENLARGTAPHNLKRIEFVFTGANGAWTQSFCRVGAIDGGRVQMQQPCWWNVTHRVAFRDATGGLPAMPPTRPPTLLRNAYRFLQPGQWYLDRVHHVLYYRLAPGQHIDRLDVEMPRLESIIAGAGSAGQPVHDITFSGITFAYATWLGPSTNAGFADVQDNLRLVRGQHESPEGTCQFSTPRGTCPFGALTREPGNVSFSRASRITFDGDVFEHLGAAGLVLDDGSRYNQVTGNVFRDIAGNAIILGDPGHPQATGAALNAFNRIDNNVIYDIGTDYPSAAAITLFFSRHTVVAHNDIHDVPYDGISAGVIQGHVDNADHPDESTNVNADNRISDNLIHGFMQTLHDGGAIYIEGRQGPGGPAPQSAQQWRNELAHGLLVEGNVAYSQGHANYTWYDDAGARWIRLQSNVEWGADKGGGQGGCQPVGDISYTGNFGSHPIAHWACTPPAPTHVVVKGNTALPVQPALDELPIAILRQAGPVAKFRHLEAGEAPRVAYMRAALPPYGHGNATVLIAGANFIPDSTRVQFQGATSVAASVLNNGMLTVQAPAGVDPCSATVITPAGRARATCAAHPVQFWTRPGDK